MAVPSLLITFRNKSQYGKQGVSMLGLADAAESIGLKSVGAKISFEQLMNDAPLPAILHWDQYHFVVLTPASRKNKLVIADPARGIFKLSKEDFIKRWISIAENGAEKGIRLFAKQGTINIGNIYLYLHKTAVGVISL